jgi:hypothetical protein
MIELSSVNCWKCVNSTEFYEQSELAGCICLHEDQKNLRRYDVGVGKMPTVVDECRFYCQEFEINYDMEKIMEVGREIMAKVLVLPSMEKLPFTWVQLECSHKVYSDAGCYTCWHCPKCGKTGCDNMAGFKEGDKVIQETCSNHERKEK